MEFEAKIPKKFGLIGPFRFNLMAIKYIEDGFITRLLWKSFKSKFSWEVGLLAHVQGQKLFAHFDQPWTYTFHRFSAIQFLLQLKLHKLLFARIPTSEPTLQTLSWPLYLRYSVLFPVLNGKSTFLGCLPTKLNQIGRAQRFYHGLSSFKILSCGSWKVDLPFRTDVCRAFRTGNSSQSELLVLKFPTENFEKAYIRWSWAKERKPSYWKQ